MSLNKMKLNGKDTLAYLKLALEFLRDIMQSSILETDKKIKHFEIVVFLLLKIKSLQNTVKKKEEADLFLTVTEQLLQELNSYKFDQLKSNVTQLIDQYSSESIEIEDYAMKTENFNLLSFALHSNNSELSINGIHINKTNSSVIMTETNVQDQSRSQAILNFSVLHDFDKKDIRITFAVIRNTTFFGSGSSQLYLSANNCDFFSEAQIVSPVISVSSNKKIGREESLLKTKFSIIPVRKFILQRASFKCVFWDYTGTYWNSSGCSDVPILSNISFECQCNHMTSFAILMSMNDYKHDCRLCDSLLSITSFIGTSISILGLCFTLAVFIFDFIRKFKKQGFFIHNFMFDYYILELISLCFSLLLMNISYIILGAGRWSEQSISCSLAGIGLHFCTLLSFGWMLSFGLLQYLTFNRILTFIKYFYLKSLCFTLVFALIPTITNISINWKLYKFEKNRCWLSGSSQTFSVILPITSVIIFNTILFLLVIKRQCTGGSQKNMIKKGDINRQVIIIATTFVNMGISWSLGLVLIIPMEEIPKTIISFVFCFFNSLQGFLIFSVYNIISKTRRKYLRNAVVNNLKNLGKSKSTTTSIHFRRTTSSNNTADSIR
nr:G protein-coupled receptor [Proales similis]